MRQHASRWDELGPMDWWADSYPEVWEWCQQKPNAACNAGHVLLWKSIGQMHFICLLDLDDNFVTQVYGRTYLQALQMANQVCFGAYVGSSSPCLEQPECVRPREWELVVQ